MVFGNYKTAPFFNKLNLLYSNKGNVIDSSDDSCGTADLIAQGDSTDRRAYNCAEIQNKPEQIVKHPQILLPIPIPVPFIEPVSTEDLDEICGLDPNGHTLEYSPRPLYQWNRPDLILNKKSQENCVDGDEILKSLISFERSLFADDLTTVSSNVSWEESDKTSLLHDQNSIKGHKSLRSFASHHSNGLCSKTYRKVRRALVEISVEDDHIYLMKEGLDANSGGFERHLAFDLDSVGDPSLPDSSVSNPRSLEPLWELKLMDIALDTPPPTPGIYSGKKCGTDSRLYCDEDYMDTDDEDVLFSSLLHRHSHSNFSYSPENWDQSIKRNYSPLFGEDCIGSFANQIQMGHTRKMFSHGRLRRRSRGQKSKRSSSRRSRHGGLPRGRHNTVEERSFSPNLSTVSEKPSEEDASCLPTPLSCKESRSLLERRFFDVASFHSEEGTTETCISSKDSDN
jgi:hypothetical protein